MLILVDGNQNAAARLSHVLRNDPGIGVIQHADVGYEEAQKTAAAYGLHIADN